MEKLTRQQLLERAKELNATKVDVKTIKEFYIEIHNIMDKLEDKFEKYAKYTDYAYVEEKGKFTSLMFEVQLWDYSCQNKECLYFYF